MTASLAAFLAAAVFEIAGCYAFWAWLRRGAPPLVTILGVLSLVAFAIALTRVESPFAGRAYAAYGGIYIASSLGWLWLIERQRPTMMDAIGAAVAIAGATEHLRHTLRDGLVRPNVELEHLHAVDVRLLPPAGSEHSPAGGGEEPRRRLADAGRSAGDECTHELVNHR